MIKLSEPLYDQSTLDVVKTILDSGQLVNGKYTKLFEEKFAKYCTASNCVTTSNGTDALFLALTAARITKKDSVLVPAITFFATIEAVLQIGAKPIFVDVNPITWCMDYKDMVEKFDNSVTACIPVHLFGQPCHDIVPMASYCKAMGITLIEDCAQAHGATVDSENDTRHSKVGSFGKMGCFSFMATKNLTCGGEGGAITTGHKHYAKKLQLLKQHGMTDRHTHEILGYNSKMSEIECAIAFQQLFSLDKNNDLRIKNSIYLRSALVDIKWLHAQYEPPNTKSVFFWCGFSVDESILNHSTLWLVDKLKEYSIECRYRYEKPLYYQPAFRSIHPEDNSFCPNAEKLAGKLIGLPNHPKLTKPNLKEIVRVIKKIDKDK